MLLQSGSRRRLRKDENISNTASWHLGKRSFHLVGTRVEENAMRHYGKQQSETSYSIFSRSVSKSLGFLGLVPSFRKISRDHQMEGGRRHRSQMGDISVLCKDMLNWKILSKYLTTS